MRAPAAATEPPARARRGAPNDRIPAPANAMASFNASRILIRNPLKVRSLKDLRGKRISFGPLGGGTERSATALLESGGISKNEVFVFHESLEETIQALQKGEIDAAFFIIGYPEPLIETLMRNRRVFLFEPDNESIEPLLNERMGLVLTSIPAGTYSHQDETITTIGVPALILARNDMDASLVKNIIPPIVKNLARVLSAMGIKGEHLNALAQMDRIDVPVHPGAQSYYEKMRKTPAERFKRLVNIVGVPVLLILVLFWMYQKRTILQRFFHRYPALRVLVALVSLWFIGSMIMYFAENRLNDNYATLVLALWSTFVNWINFNSKEPITIAGRIDSTLMIILGMGEITWFVGEVAAIFIKKSLNEANMCKTMKDHFIVINWNEMGPALLKNIRGMEKENNIHTDIILVTETHTANIKSFTHLAIDPLAKEIAEVTNMQHARSVIIMSSSDLGPEEADTRNILIVLNIEKQLKKGSGKRPNIVVEILSPAKEHLLNAGIYLWKLYPPKP